jgi:AcrR family transcriptional regulator
MDGQSAGRTQNRKGQGARLRDEIIDAAIGLISDDDEPLTLRAVARRAGITAPSIYAHFDSLDSVIHAAVAATFRELAERLSTAAGQASDPVLRLCAACRAYVEFGTERPMQYRLLFAYAHDPAARARSGAGTAEEKRGTHKDIGTMEGAEAFRIVCHAIEECMAAGRSRSIDPVADAIGLWVALHGYVGLRTGMPYFPWPAEDELVEQLVARLARLS